MDWEEIYCRLELDNNDSAAWQTLERRVTSWGRAVFWSRGTHVVQDAVADTCAAVALNLGDARGPDTFAGFVYGHFLTVRRRLLRGAPTWVPLDGLELPAPDQVEDGADAEQTEQADHEQDCPYFTELRIVGAVVVGDVVRVGAARQLHRYDELEVASIVTGAGLMAGEKGCMRQRRIDAGPTVE